MRFAPAPACNLHQDAQALVHHSKAALPNANVKRPGRGQGKALHGLKGELQRLRKLSAAAAGQPMSTNDYLLLQVEAIQDAFMSLADAVVQELDDLRAEASSWQAERQTLLSDVRSLHAGVTDRLLDIEKASTRLELGTSASHREQQAVLVQQAEAAAARITAAERDLFDVRCDVQVLRIQLDNVEVMATTDLPQTVLRQRLADRAGLEAEVAEAVRSVAPSVVAMAVQAEAPAAVQKAVQSVMREVVERRTESLRLDMASAVERMGGEVATARKAVREVATEVTDISSRCQAFEGTTSALGERLGGLESLEASNPRPHIGSLHGLQDKVEGMATQHARYAKSMEGVVRALVDDAGRLARAAKGRDAQLVQQRQHHNDTREALLRCAAVFSQLLKVPSPVPLAVLAPLGSPAPPSPAFSDMSAH